MELEKWESHKASLCLIFSMPALHEVQPAANSLDDLTLCHWGESTAASYRIKQLSVYMAPPNYFCFGILVYESDAWGFRY